MADNTDGESPASESPSADHLDPIPPGADPDDGEFTQADTGGAISREVSDIVPASSWGRVVRAGKSLSKMNPARDVYIHHEGSGEAKIRDTPLTETMKRLERAALSHPDHIAIDYSFVVSDTFKAEGRGWLIQGSHTEGHNSTSHAICAPGNYTLHDPRPALLTKIAELIVEGVRRGSILQPFNVKPHRDPPGNDCPARLRPAIPTIVAQVNALLGGVAPVVPSTDPEDDVPQIMEQPIRPGEGPRSALKPQVAILERRRVVLLNGASMMNDKKDGDRRVLDIPAAADLIGWVPAAPGAEGLPNGGPMGGVVAVTADGQAFHAAWS